MYGDNALSMDYRWTYDDILSTVFLAGLVAMLLLMCELREDIARFNRKDGVGKAQTDCGWTSIHGDVFRSPRCGLLLAAFVDLRRASARPDTD